MKAVLFFFVYASLTLLTSYHGPQRWAAEGSPRTATIYYIFLQILGNRQQEENAPAVRHGSYSVDCGRTRFFVQLETFESYLLMPFLSPVKRRTSFLQSAVQRGLMARQDFFEKIKSPPAFIPCFCVNSFSFYHYLLLSLLHTLKWPKMN